MDNLGIKAKPRQERILGIIQWIENIEYRKFKKGNLIYAKKTELCIEY